MTLQEFMIDKKMRLLAAERAAKGAAKVFLTAQMQMVESILIFLASKQTEDDMAKLELSLVKKPLPLSELKPRNGRNEELTEAILEVASKLQPNTYLPLNNLPPNIKLRSISAKIYSLKEAGKIDKNIFPRARGKELNLAREE